MQQKINTFLDYFDKSSIDDDYDDGSISMNTLKDIRDGNYVHLYINARDDRVKICDRIILLQSKQI